MSDALVKSLFSAFGLKVERVKRRRCKCGKPCAFYGPIGGYSVACVKCNAKNAKRERIGRRRRKEVI